jgi:TonB-dependent receptor
MPSNVSPQDIPRYLRFDLERTTGGQGFGWSDNEISDENYTAQLDLESTFSVGSWLSGNIKIGGKLRQKNRDRSGTSWGIFDWDAYFLVFSSKFPDYNRNSRTYFTSNFIDDSYTGYDFPFGDQYELPFVFDEDIIASHYEAMHGIDSLWFKNFEAEFDRYDAFERISAGYTMMELNFGEKLLFIPGFRFESTYNEYTGVVGRAKRDDRRYDLRDTTSSATKNNFLPMFHLRYRIIEGFSLRLAATKTLTRPDFLNLAPFERVEALAPGRGVVGRGSLGLKIPTAWNYDAILSYYSKIGLFSVAGFYKEIENIDVDAQFKDYSGSRETNPYYGYESENPINLDQTTTVKGIEFEVQTNLRFLPKPLDGIVLSGNYSIIRSESFYPYFPVSYPPPDYLPVVTDTFRSNSLQGQADYIVNFTVGYEKGGFSGRISMNYQGPKLNVSGAERFQDEYTAEYMRWDATLSQKVFDNWMILVNLINITSELERSYVFSESRPTLEEYYGWQANLGIRYSF